MFVAGNRRATREKNNLLSRFTTMGNVFALLALVVLSGACDKPSHESLDKWLDTQKGPGKIKDALGDSGLDPDLRAHAAENMIVMLGQEQEVYKVLDDASEGSRQKILAKLAPRLWEKARLQNRMSQPNGRQLAAKDAMFYLRKYADADNKSVLDGYLLDWLTGGYYEVRANSGSVRGEQIVRAIGPGAAGKMLEAINAVVAAPEDDKGRVVTIGPKLILGVAVTGSPKAVAKLLEMAASEGLNKKHRKLQEQIFIALELAYVEPEDFEAADPKALTDNVDALSALVKDEGLDAGKTSMIINLLSKVDAADCVAPFVAMVAQPHSNVRYRWIGAQRALSCAKLGALDKVVKAFPTTGRFARDDFEGSVWSVAAKLTPKAEVATAARALLGEDSWVARVSGVEILGLLGYAETAAADAAAVRKLAADTTVLQGWWGDQSDIPKKKRKRDPKLGTRAAAVAKRLEELAKGANK